MRSKSPFLLVLFCVVLGLVAYSRKEDPPGTISSRYVLTKPDGTKVRSRTVKTNDRISSEGSLPFWGDELASASGSIVFITKSGPDFTVETEGTIVGGKIEGMIRVFMLFEGKRIKTLEQEYLHDQKHGRSAAYFPDGTIMTEGAWRNGLKHGPWTINALKFKPAVTLCFNDDLLDGELKILDPKGAVIVRGEYQQGKPIDGTFIENPWGMLEATTRYEKTFDTTLLHFKDGEQVSATPISLETGR